MRRILIEPRARGARQDASRVATAILLALAAGGAGCNAILGIDPPNVQGDDGGDGGDARDATTSDGPASDGAAGDGAAGDGADGGDAWGPGDGGGSDALAESGADAGIDAGDACVNTAARLCESFDEPNGQLPAGLWNLTTYTGGPGNFAIVYDAGAPSPPGAALFDSAADAGLSAAIRHEFSAAGKSVSCSFDVKFIAVPGPLSRQTPFGLEATTAETSWYATSFSVSADQVSFGDSVLRSDGGVINKGQIGSTLLTLNAWIRVDVRFSLVDGTMEYWFNGNRVVNYKENVQTDGGTIKAAFGNADYGEATILFDSIDCVVEP